MGESAARALFDGVFLPDEGWSVRVCADVGV